MAYKGETAEVVLGSRGLNGTTNPKRIRPDDLVDAQGVIFLDGCVTNELGANALDSVGITGVPAFRSTLTGAQEFAGCLVTFKSNSGTPAATGTPANGVAAAASAVTTGNVTAIAGTLVVVTVAIKSTSSSTRVSTVTDAAGNTYTFADSKQSAALSGTYWTAETWVSRNLSFALVAQTVTVTLTNGSSVVQARAQPFTCPGGSIDRIAEVSNLSTLMQLVAAPLVQVPELLVVSSICDSSTGDSFGAVAGWTATQVNSTGTRMLQSYRVDTATPTIVAMHDWDSGTRIVATGTINTTAGSTTVAGTLSLFTTEASVGDTIRIGSEDRVISNITSATALTVTTPWASTNAASAFDLIAHQRLVVATLDGSLYRSRNTSAFNLDDTTLKTGLSVVARPGRFVQAGKEAAGNARKLFYFNGYNVVQQLIGEAATAVDIVAPAADWSGTNQPLNGVHHRNRLWGFGNINDPHRIYGSVRSDHDDFTTVTGTDPSVSLLIGSQVGNRIYCGISFQGLLWLWKNPRGIFWVDDSDFLPSNWQVRMKSEGLGCAPSSYAALALDDDILFMASDASFHLLTAIDTPSGVRDSDLSERLQIKKWITRRVNRSLLSQVVSLWDPTSKTALFGVPSTGSTINDLTLRFDFSELSMGNPPKFSYSYRDYPGALALWRDSSDIEGPIVGEGGRVYSLNYATRSKDSAGYTSFFQTPYDDLGWKDAGAAAPKLAHTKKVWQFVELVLVPSDTTAATLPPGAVSSSSSTSDTLTLDFYSDRLLQKSISITPTNRRQRVPVCGTGYSYSLVLTGSSTSGARWTVSSYVIGFERGAEDQPVAITV